MGMRVHHLVAAVAVALIAYSGFVVAQDDPLTVRVGVYDNNPKIYRDADGTIKGFFADLTNYIAEQEGWNVIYVHDTWENNLQRLENGEIDLMVDVAVSEERKLLYDFNEETALTSWGIMYTREGFELDSIMDLEGSRIAILKSGILYSGPYGLQSLLTSFGISAEIIDVDIYGDVFEILDRKEADVAVVNWFYGITNEKDHNVTHTNVIFQPSDLKYALTKGAPHNATLIAAIDKHLVAIRADLNGPYHRIYRDNFSQFIETQEVLPMYAKYVAVGIGAIFVLFFIVWLSMRQYQRSLKRQVDRQTSEIQVNNTFLTKLITNMPDQVFVKDAKDLRYVRFNKAAEDFIGYSGSDLLGKTDYDLFPKEQADQFTKTDRNVLASRQLFDISHEEIRTKNKGMRILHTKKVPILNDMGEPVFLLGISEDITERQKILDVQRVKNEFVALAIQQLQTPVASITGQTSTVEEQLKTVPVSEQLKKCLDGIKSESKRTRAIVKFLNGIAGTADGVKLQFDPIDLREMTQMVMGMLGNMLEDKFQRVEIIQNPDPFPSPHADRDAVQQVILILLSNASEYSLSGSTIKISIKLSGQFAEYSVQDNGIGIPPEARERIFERFFRAENAKTLIDEGVGLGLPYAKSLVEAWGGKLSFESEENRGSIFTFTIPLSFTEQSPGF